MRRIGRRAIILVAVIGDICRAELGGARRLVMAANDLAIRRALELTGIDCRKIALTGRVIAQTPHHLKQAEWAPS